MLLSEKVELEFWIFGICIAVGMQGLQLEQVIFRELEQYGYETYLNVPQTVELCIECG